MSEGFARGTRVAWDWGNGTGTGTITERFTEKVTCIIKDTQVSRNASANDPAYLIEQDDGDQVLKGHSELRRAD